MDWGPVRSGWQWTGADCTILHPGWWWRRLSEVRRRRRWVNASALVVSRTPRVLWARSPTSVQQRGGRGGHAFVLGGRVGGGITPRPWVGVATRWGAPAGWGAPARLWLTANTWLSLALLWGLGRLRNGMRGGWVRGRGLAVRGRVSIVGNLVEEDIILKWRAGVQVKFGLFGQNHLQTDSDSVLMWKYGEGMQQCRTVKNKRSNKAAQTRTGKNYT